MSPRQLYEFSDDFFFFFTNIIFCYLLYNYFIFFTSIISIHLCTSYCPICQRTVHSFCLVVFAFNLGGEARDLLWEKSWRLHLDISLHVNISRNMKSVYWLVCVASDCEWFQFIVHCFSSAPCLGCGPTFAVITGGVRPTNVKILLHLIWIYVLWPKAINISTVNPNKFTLRRLWTVDFSKCQCFIFRR